MQTTTSSNPSADLFQNGSADAIKAMLANAVQAENPSSGGGDFWRSRGEALVSSAVSVLVEMRDRGQIALTADNFCHNIALGVGVPASSDRSVAAGGAGYTDVSEITAEDWAAIRGNPGMIELYLRALNGEFSETTRDRLKGFFDSLVDFSLTKALQGAEQGSKTVEQYVYLTMQIARSCREETLAH